MSDRYYIYDTETGILANFAKFDPNFDYKNTGSTKKVKPNFTPGQKSPGGTFGKLGSGLDRFGDGLNRSGSNAYKALTSGTGKKNIGMEALSRTKNLWKTGVGKAAILGGGYLGYRTVKGLLSQKPKRKYEYQ
jgi:hypothetical protein